MSKIKILRQREVEVDNIKIGDQILIPINGFGEFKATAQYSGRSGILFIFDECVCCMPINKINSNDGGFDNSYLKSWLNNELLPKFPSYLPVRELTIPSIGEMFGWDDEWIVNTFEKDNTEQLPLMKNVRNRIGILNNDVCCTWLRNKTKNALSSADFALVSYYGFTACGNASHSCGVRPEFRLLK